MLMGEYSVLYEGGALMAAIPPRFELHCGGSSAALSFHPDSPAGRFLKKSQRNDVVFSHWRDPFQQQGGFGASTAQFALCFAALFPEKISAKFCWEVWETYRALHQEDLKPSGTDLMAQWLGGLLFFQPIRSLVEPVKATVVLENILVFQASHQKNRKINTHEHLQTLKKTEAFEEGTKELSDLVQRGKQALENNNALELGRLCNQYAQILSDLGLECPAAREDRLVFSAMDGVAGVKGVGAALADALIIVVNERGRSGYEEANLQKVLEMASQRGLLLLQKGLSLEPGIEADKAVAVKHS